MVNPLRDGPLTPGSRFSYRAPNCEMIIESQKLMLFIKNNTSFCDSIIFLKNWCTIIFSKELMSKFNNIKLICLRI